MELQIKLLSDNAKAPMRATELAAGFDLFSAENKFIPARGRAIIATDISIAVPYGTYGRIAPRSGLASKFGIDVGAGVIDADYRGPVGVLLFNHSDENFSVTQGQRIAQLILEKIGHDASVQVVDQLGNTQRGQGGFGSTGDYVLKNI